MWPSPLLAPVSTVGKTRLVVVAVQGAPRLAFLPSLGIVGPGVDLGFFLFVLIEIGPRLGRLR